MKQRTKPIARMPRVDDCPHKGSPASLAPAAGDYNPGMLQRSVYVIGRLLMLFVAAHRIWFAALCFYCAWMVAPFWVFAIPATLGSLSLVAGILQTVDEIRRWRFFL